MRIAIICPAPPGSRYGNRISATRWARILRGMGHRVTIRTNYSQETCDLLIALHAKRSAQSVLDFAALYRNKPVIVALTGTDVYRDIHRSRIAQRVLELAARLVVLQPLAIEELAPRFRPKARVVYQSVERIARPPARSARAFEVAVVGHLRAVKDPFRAAMAVRRLPETSRIRIVHGGAAMSERMELRARSEEERNARYRWLGEVPRWKARRLIASSRVLVLSSRMEGGANVISEAIAAGTPVLASHIPGSVGLLGASYPGLYKFGDTNALRDLLLRAEQDTSFYGDLLRHVQTLAALVQPERERSVWKNLIGELANLDTAAERKD